MYNTNIDPEISVLLPCFNAERYLSACLESILKSTYKSFEIIAVDDGSTDKTGIILQDFAAIDPRIIIIKQENYGIVNALNKALERARGRYCARMDADDISLPDRFEIQYAFLETNPHVIVVGGQGYTIDEDGDFISPFIVFADHKSIDDDLLNKFNGRALIHPSVMFRTDTIRSLGGYREDYIWAEDLDLFLRAAEIGEIANLDSVVIYFRKHSNSISNRRSDLQRANAMKAANDARSRRGIPNVQYPIVFTTIAKINRIDNLYSTAINALANGWHRTAIKYLIKIVEEYGLTKQALKLTLRIGHSFVKVRSK